MPQREPSGPDLTGVIADANAVGLKYVVIGGFSVIYHGYIRATKDSDLLVPDGPDANAAVLRFLERIDGARLRDDRVLTLQDIASVESLRISSRHGIIDIMRGGLPPLDYDTVAGSAAEVDIGGQHARVASLPSLVGFKRLAGRPQDRMDLEELESIYGPLPIEPIPGLDIDT
ncbi:MAG: hypothetical protein ACRDK2_07425 [Solirubrobacteraceae bacterium]